MNVKVYKKIFMHAWVYQNTGCYLQNVKDYNTANDLPQHSL